MEQTQQYMYERMMECGDKKGYLKDELIEKAKKKGGGILTTKQIDKCRKKAIGRLPEDWRKQWTKSNGQVEPR